MPDDVQAPDATGQMPAQPAPNLGTGAATPQLAPQGYQGPRPILMDLIQGLVKPRMQASAPGQPATPVSRAQTFENFLGNFVYALGQGFANEGHGPGAGFRGAGAAATAPLQLGMQQQQFQSEQAQRQAQTELTQQQTEASQQSTPAKLAALQPQPRWDPSDQHYLGLMNDAQYQQYVSKQGGAAQAAGAKITAEKLKIQTMTGQLGRVETAKDGSRIAYNKFGQKLGPLEDAIDPKSLPTTSTSQQWIETSPGVWNLVDKTSTTRKGFGPVGSGGPAIGGPAAFPQAQSTPKASRIPTPSGGTAGSVAPAPVSGGASRQGRTLFGAKPAVAFNPQTGEREVTTTDKANQGGMSQILPVKDGDVEKWSSATRQFNDVQINTSRYTSAARDYQTANLSSATRADDQVKLHDLLNKAGIADMNIAISQGGHIDLPLITALGEGLSRESKSSAYAGLSPQAKGLYDGYMRTIASVPAYQKALTGVGRFNKEVMEMEIRNIPDPSMNPPDISRKLGQWQENIDRGYEGTPRIQGIDTPKDIRKQYEGLTEVQIPGQKSGLIHGSRVEEFRKRYPAARVAK